MYYKHSHSQSAKSQKHMSVQMKLVVEQRDDGVMRLTGTDVFPVLVAARPSSLMN